MKKFLTVMTPIFFMIFVAAVCIGIYMFFTNKIPNFKDTKSNTELQQNLPNLTSDIILSEEELPVLDATTIVRPLMSEIVKDFTKDQNVKINYSEDDEAYKNLLNGETDILLANYPNADVLALASSMGVELEVIPIAKEALVFLVNSNNSVNTLKVSDIQKIYSGQISNWSQLGGENLNINAFQNPEGTNIQTDMISYVMKNLQMITAPKDVFYDKQYGQINDLIAKYDNSNNSIGYMYYSVAKILYDIDEEKTVNKVKLLSINDIEPNYETIHNEKYPILTNYYIIKNKNNNSERVQIFMNAILSERGKNAVKEAGYIDN